MIELDSFIAYGERQKDKNTAEVIRTACDGKTAVIRSVERQKKTNVPPTLYDLTLFAGLFSANKSAADSLGNRPRCGSAIRESAKGFFCDTSSCGFKIWKESKFWTAKKKQLTALLSPSCLKTEVLP